MKTSLADNPGPQNVPSILLRGAPGSGKSVLGCQFPNPGILDCDENLSGAARFVRASINPKLEYRYSRVRYKDDVIPITESTKWWDNYLTELTLMVADPWVRTIITDSLTGLDEMLLRYIAGIQKRLDPSGEISEMQIQDWIPFRSRLKNLTMKMRQTGKVNIVTCHEESVRQKQTQEIIRYDITLSSKLSEIFGWIFSDVWYIESQVPLGGKIRNPLLYCHPMGLRKDLKNCWGMPESMEATWTNVNKYLKL